jgi:hypothetical protein
MNSLINRPEFKIKIGISENRVTEVDWTALLMKKKKLKEKSSEEIINLIIYYLEEAKEFLKK